MTIIRLAEFEGFTGNCAGGATSAFMGSGPAFERAVALYRKRGSPLAAHSATTKPLPSINSCI
jgi:hypothetical protein